MKLGVNQASTVLHIHRTGKTDERNATFGALFPIYHLASNSLAFFLSFFLSFLLSYCFSFFLTFLLFFFLSLFLSFFVFLFFRFFFFFLSLSLTLPFLWQISFEQCHMFKGLSSDNLN